MKLFVCAVLAFVLAASPAGAAPVSATDGELTDLFVRYYQALKKERWEDAFGLLHERLKESLQVLNAHDLAVRQYGAQRELIEAFKAFDHIDVAKAEVDLTSIKGTVTGTGDGNTAGRVVYDLIVFRAGPGRPLMYRVVMDVGLEKGKIIRLTQGSIVRIDPGSVGDVM